MMDQVRAIPSSSSSSSTTLTSAEARGESTGKTDHVKGNGQKEEVVPTPPIGIPTVPSIHGNDEILPAEADNRDRQIQKDKPPDSNATSVPGSDKEPDIYDRFTPGKKRAILAIVSYSAFISRTSHSHTETDIADIDNSCHIFYLFAIYP